MLTAICKNQFCGGYVLGSPKVDPESGEVSELVDPMFVFSAVRKRSGIATECCEKRCSLSYLKTFCCAGYEAATAAND
ncbi:CRE-INS-1 protein [Aphelenchoides avenae]|nr:CRE-INS-1 protein [Aphelenchus avenae]